MKKLLISTANAEYQIITSLKQNRTKRSKLGEIFVEGIESIKQAQRAGVAFTRIIAGDRLGLSDWAKGFIAANQDATVVEMSAPLYRELCDRDEPSEIVVTAKISAQDFWEIELSDNPCVLIFDRPSDHGNFGTILRSANSFAVDAVFVIGHAIDIYDPKVIRSSLGGIFHTKIAAVPSMEELRQWVAAQKERSGLRLVGSDSTGSVSLESHRLARPIALVLGNEAKGMSVALKELCDYVVSIPLAGSMNSLNVSCAGSILLWEIFKNSAG
ncbi:MAG: RNA methyltransferase [Caldilineaceae bacterium]|nr:RNA methyltransferase [Caldilineaceae bacterium]HRW47202.1 TrmH family RNA methyltransferase [Caldilinea sp.]